MADAATLNQKVLGGLDRLVADDPKVYADQLYENALDAIERQSGDRAREINENVFSRGLGLSTIARDMQASREREVLDAKTRARRESDIASRQAQLSALGQAAGAASSDLNRQQSSAQFGANQQMQKKQLNQQSSIANMNALTQGVGGLGMAGLYMGGKMFAPEIKAGLKGLFSSPGGGPSGSADGIPEGPAYDAYRAGERIDYGQIGSSDSSPLTYDLGADYTSFDPGGLADFESYAIDPSSGYGDMAFDLGGLDWLAAMEPDPDVFRWGDYL